ncbi:MAG: deoxyhypusine synthase [Planctomycetes bacterium GWA2_40_7]|nr:MAG: deoxyhypusine synthase [Planctomycetes bacterium GWA2_40_7]
MKKHASLRKKYLCKAQILPITFREDMKVADLVESFSCSGAFNAGRLAEACKLFLKMVEEDTTIALTLSGAMTPAGLGGTVISMMERGLIDFIISTGANLYHDLHFAIGLPIHQGDFRVDDSELFKAGIERIYDIFITDEVLLETDAFLQQVIEDAGTDRVLSTAEFHYMLGKAILEKCPYPEHSLVAHAARYDVPIFTSSPGDSSIGMNLAAKKLTQKNGNITIDSDLDVLQTTAIVYNSKKNGALAIGGGSPKNFYMQTQPTLSQIFGFDSKGHDYFVQITTDSPQWGGLSGATPREAISWGKMCEKETQNHVVVYCDATIAMPILTAYILSSKQKRNPKRLYTKLPEFVSTMRKHVENLQKNNPLSPKM